jgi:extracellular matrix regulatory protein A
MNVGFDNFVPWWRVVAILLPNTSPAERYREKAEAEGRLVSVCAGRRRRSFIVTDTNQVIVSSVGTETLIGRLEAKRIEEDQRLRTITIQNEGRTA